MKKRLIVIISFIVLMGIIIGVTLAWFRWNSSTNTDVTFEVQGASITYSAGNNISNIKLIPVSTKEKGVTDNTAIYKEITASANKTMYLTLNMALTTFSSGLADSTLVWEIYKGNTKIGNGNFASKSQGDTITLFENEEINSTTSTYKLYIWIDGTVENPLTMENQDFLFTLNATATDEVPPQPLDKSGANAPKLVQGLIPVRYDNTNSTWVKADSTNMDANNQWYDYDSKMWANAVLVSSTNRSTYQSANAGTAIPESDVLAYYVWIPRYKYKVWNINKVIGTDSYNAQTTGIDIVFENGTASTGTVSCTYDFSVTATASVRNETCTGSNGDYYTHPAFTFGSDELEGIWVGKFEVSSETPDVLTNDLEQGTGYYGGGESTSLTVRIKPNVRSWRDNLITNFYIVIYDMQVSNNIYGLNTDRSNTDSHMIKNIEWGAVAYITNSKYGRCTNNTCTEVTINNSSDFITGNAGSTVSASVALGTTNAYNTIAGQLASTTGNIYGIYDMSGGSYEDVMGNMSSDAGSYTYYAMNAGSNFSYSISTAKYIDTYANGSSFNNQTAYNRSRLGDATGEIVLTTGNHGSWYSDGSAFVKSSTSWFSRGGFYEDESFAGLFEINWGNGYGFFASSTRAALIGF